VRTLPAIVASALTLTHPTFCLSQAAQLDPSKQQAFHEHVAALLQGPRAPLPAGDTAVSWTERGPILYFTTHLAGDTIATAMAREDGLVGTTTAIWSHGRMASFRTTWTRGDSVLLEIVGAIRGQQLVLRGRRDTSLAIPSMPWLVADYGLEDLTVPLLRQADSSATQFVALRPYPFKWDTVTIRGRRSGGYLVVSAVQGPKVRETYVLDDRGVLLLRRGDQVMERRPLEGTARFADFLRALPALGLER
jgi:hypothetical protein